MPVAWAKVWADVEQTYRKSFNNLIMRCTPRLYRRVNNRCVTREAVQAASLAGRNNPRIFPEPDGCRRTRWGRLPWQAASANCDSLEPKHVEP